MSQKNPFEKFIEKLNSLNNLKNEDVELVDKALAQWFATAYPEGIPFEFDFEKRDLLVGMVKAGREVSPLITASDFLPYINAVLSAVSKGSTKRLVVLTAAFILGYALKVARDKKPPKKRGK